MANSNPTTPTVSISITQSLSMRVGETKLLTVTTQSTDFTVTNAPAGSGCAKSGINTVSYSPTTAGTYTITVTATADPKPSASATVTLSPAITISITPELDSVPAGGSAEFTVVAENTDFTLSAPAAAGCARSGNVITCELTAEGTHNIAVTATADVSKTAAAQIAVYTPGSETVSADGTLRKTMTFTASDSWTASVSGAGGSACTVNPPSGASGKNTVSVTCNPNSSNADRSIEISIVSAVNGQTLVVIPIAQKPAPRYSDFTNVSYSEAGDTALYGINNSGRSIGNYYYGAKATGFLLSK